MTQIGLFLFFVVPPNVAKASTSVSLSHVIVAGIIAPTFANVNTALQRASLTQLMTQKVLWHWGVAVRWEIMKENKQKDFGFASQTGQTLQKSFIKLVLDSFHLTFRLCTIKLFTAVIDIQHNDIQHNDTQHKGIISIHAKWLPAWWHSSFGITLPLCRMSLCWVSHFINCYAECHYAEYHYAECRYTECHYAGCCYA
jgi:hypothetical protein